VARAVSALVGGRYTFGALRLRSEFDVEEVVFLSVNRIAASSSPAVERFALSGNRCQFWRITVM
jgi:hypothetical protein